MYAASLLRGKQHPRYVDACGQKGVANVIWSTKTHKVLLGNYTGSMEIGISKSLIL